MCTAETTRMSVWVIYPGAGVYLHGRVRAHMHLTRSAQISQKGVPLPASRQF